MLTLGLGAETATFLGIGLDEQRDRLRGEEARLQPCNYPLLQLRHPNRVSGPIVAACERIASSSSTVMSMAPSTSATMLSGP